MHLIFDTETTGKADFNAPPEAPHQPRLVQLGAVLYDDAFKMRGSINYIIKPDNWRMEAEAVEKHGITVDIAEKYGVSEVLVLSMFEQFLAKATTIVAHNIQFDGLIMGHSFHLHSQPFTMPVVKRCTMRDMTNVCKLPGPRGFKWPKLQEAHKHCFGVEFDGAHDAMADVLACGRVFQWLMTEGKTTYKPSAPSLTNVNTNPVQRPPSPPAEPYGDDDPCPFGQKWKGVKLRNVDPSFFCWLWGKRPISDPRLEAYIKSRIPALKLENPDLIFN